MYRRGYFAFEAKNILLWKNISIGGRGLRLLSYLPGSTPARLIFAVGAPIGTNSQTKVEQLAEI